MYWGMVSHQLNESVEQITHVVRAWARFRVSLEAEGGGVGAGDALQRAIEQRDVGAAQVGRHRFRVHRKTVVLTGDGDTPAIEVLHGMIGAVMAELHLDGPGARGEREQLVAEADAEERNLR